MCNHGSMATSRILIYIYIYYTKKVKNLKARVSCRMVYLRITNVVTASLCRLIKQSLSEIKLGQVSGAVPPSVLGEDVRWA